MTTSILVVIVGFVFIIPTITLFIILIIKAIKALNKYVKSGDVRKEKITTKNV